MEKSSEKRERDSAAYYGRAGNRGKERLMMPKNPILSEVPPFDPYPDPLGRARGAAVSDPLTDIALAGDMPASRLFATLPVSLARDIRAEMRREREEN